MRTSKCDHLIGTTGGPYYEHIHESSPADDNWTTSKIELCDIFNFCPRCGSPLTVTGDFIRGAETLEKTSTKKLPGPKLYFTESVVKRYLGVWKRRIFKNATPSQ